MHGVSFMVSPGKRRTEGGRSASEGEARLAVNLPVHLHRQLKARAAAEGVSIRDFILTLLRRSGIR
jgi:predicted HicB family RNase H-like nuclease